jgi:hypothetical protein
VSRREATARALTEAELADLDEWASGRAIAVGPLEPLKQRVRLLLSEHAARGRALGGVRARLLELVRTYGREIAGAELHRLAPVLDHDVDDFCDCGGTAEDHDEEAQRALDRIETELGTMGADGGSDASRAR